LDSAAQISQASTMHWKCSSAESISGYLIFYFRFLFLQSLASVSGGAGSIQHGVTTLVTTGFAEFSGFSQCVIYISTILSSGSYCRLLGLRSGWSACCRL